jgi:AcrR family transcriptional regulator
MCARTLRRLDLLTVLSKITLMSSTEPTRAARIRDRSSKRRERRKEALRQTILDAASSLFVEHGYEQFSLRQVAERIGYTATTIYHHFADKDELLFEVLLEGFESFGQRLQTAYESEHDPAARLEAAGRAYVRFGLEHRVHYRLMFMERPEFLLRPGVKDDRKPTIDSFGVLFKIVEELIASGSVEPVEPRTLANLLWSGVHGIVALAIASPTCDDVQAERLTDLYLPSILKGLRPTHGGTP